MHLILGESYTYTYTTDIDHMSLTDMSSTVTHVIEIDHLKKSNHKPYDITLSLL